MERRYSVAKRCTAIIVLIGMTLFLLGTNSLAYTIMFSSALNKNYMGIKNPPLYFTLFNGFSTETVNAIHNANTTWNNGGVGDLVYKYTNTTHNITATNFNDYSANDGINRILKGNLGTGNGIIAQARIYGTENLGILKIIEADIVFNVSYPFGSGNSTNYFDVETVILHELGHAIGLDHSTVGTVMQPASQEGVLVRTLSQDDKNGLDYLY